MTVAEKESQIHESTIDHLLESAKESRHDGAYKLRTKIIIITVVVLVFMSALSGYLIGSADYVGSRAMKPLAVAETLKTNGTRLRVFKRAAVCTDAPRCSQIGRNILQRNGSAVDAAIASMFCNELINQQSMGLGGGFFMTVYIKDEEKAYSVIAREKAPGAATVDMFHGDPIKASLSPYAVAVPGELRGMWAAYKRWGKLPWASLLEPTLEICKTGYPMSQVMYDYINYAMYVKDDYHLRNQFVNKFTNQFYVPGTIVKPSDALCNTYQRIAENGGDELYNGSLAVDFADDLKRVGSIITAEDLRLYEPKITEPISLSLGNGDTLYAPPPPGSGAVLALILNILSGYHFNSSSINTTEDTILTYHRIIEAFKYAYAARTKLGDMDFLDLEELINNVTSPEYGAQIRLRINDSSTSNDTAAYGVSEYNQPDAGTAHISVVAPSGDAVSVTSSIDIYFGVGFTTFKTGIILNNVMNDFSSPGIINKYDVKPSPANLIAPYKRPQSSISPSIIVDKDGNVKLVIGGSGGTKITTSVALVTMRKLWFGQTIKEAVDAPRIYHQIFPMNVDYDFSISEDIIKGLRAKGHGALKFYYRGSVVCALYRNETATYGNADCRKGGDVAGID